ncbi:MAG: GNAT family N-acetyltransferase [Desulfobulbus sp.]|uniref:GNAT family N-acetyltransferase n=1 Tax=Desulfobulbus sp. TaxID=895 RepID=UPI00284D8F93|nr:GNAT family N-acetyltransferase [Desulfobulbus sp.]MDR2549535.1 GNAT family N-acetyltransferase [Desulfobulbus sp.]
MPTLKKIWPLMEEAFPACERRTLAQHRQAAANPLYRLEPIRSGEAFAGFLGCWHVEEYLFVEHFALEKRFRGSGLGTSALKYLVNQGRPVVLEVEPPKGFDAATVENRRIRFFEQSGFVRQPYSYYQPAYDGSDARVPLLLMVHGKGRLPEEEFVRLRDALFRIVYAIPTP